MLLVEELKTKSKKEVNYPRTSFTFKNLEVLNPDVKPQTLRLKLKQSLESGSVIKSNQTSHSGGRGRAEHLYVLMVAA